MNKMKVLVLAQTRGPEKIEAGRPTGEYPHGLSQSVAFFVDGIRVQQKLYAGDIVEMDITSAKKLINIGLCQKASIGAKVKSSPERTAPMFCPICGTALKPGQKYCDEDCADRARRNREESEALKNPTAAAEAARLASMGVRETESGEPEKPEETESPENTED